MRLLVSSRSGGYVALDQHIDFNTDEHWFEVVDARPCRYERTPHSTLKEAHDHYRRLELEFYRKTTPPEEGGAMK